MSKYLSSLVAAELLGVNDEKIRRWIADGSLKAFNVTQDASNRPRWRISEDDLRAFLETRASRPPEKKRRRRKREAVQEFIK